MKLFRRIERFFFPPSPEELTIIDIQKRILGRDEKVSLLLAEVLPQALATKLHMDKTAVPESDESRVLVVSPRQLQLANELGYDRIVGLKLKAGMWSAHEQLSKGGSA